MNKNPYLRRGNMLIDLLICMGAASALFLTTIDVLHRTLAASRSSTESSRIVQTIHRLDLQFRRDIQNATSVLSESERGVVVDRPEGKAEYTVEPKYLVRQWKGTLGESQTERYSLPLDAIVRFEVSEGIPLAKLRVSVPREEMPDRVLLHCVAMWSVGP